LAQNAARYFERQVLALFRRRSLEPAYRFKPTPEGVGADRFVDPSPERFPELVLIATQGVPSSTHKTQIPPAPQGPELI
jgi:hypothetical protein